MIHDDQGMMRKPYIMHVSTTSGIDLHPYYVIGIVFLTTTINMTLMKTMGNQNKENQMIALGFCLFGRGWRVHWVLSK